MIRFHRAFVDALLDARGEAASSHLLAPLLRKSLRAVWLRASRSLGEVTVAAIFQRVLSTARRTHPLLDHVRLSAGAGPIEVDELVLARTGSFAAVRDATRTLLVEVLSVFGRLTGEALSPGLHDALSSSMADASDTHDEVPQQRVRRG